MRSKIIATGIVLVLLACASFATGQTATGGVNGNVSDPSGAVVPGATIKLKNEATQVETLIINANATQIAASAGRVNALAQGTTPRQMQFGLRFVF